MALHSFVIPLALALPQDAAQPQVPWPVQLGYRTMALERSWPVVDQVVLVPDGRTYLDEIAKWSESARWPVLLEDDLYAPLFVRGFGPARVIRRASAGAMPAERAERETLISKSAAAAIVEPGKGKEILDEIVQKIGSLK